MKQIQQILYCLLLITVVSFQSFGEETNPRLLSIIKSNPEKVVEMLTPNLAQQKGSLQDYKTICRAYINLGQYYKADSILDYTFSQFSFKTDSVMYFSLLELDAENKKILEMYDESLSSLNQVLDYTLRKGTKQDLIDVYIQFGEYYRAATNFDLSLHYLYKAMQIGNKTPGGLPPLVNARILNRLAAVYAEQAIYPDSVEHLSKRVIALATRYGDSGLVASSCNELGFYYLNTNNPIGVIYFKKAIAIWTKLGITSHAYHAKLNLARYYLRNEMPHDAIELANEGIVVAKQNAWEWDEGFWNEVFSGAYERLGDYKKALYHMNLAKVRLLKLSVSRYKERLAYYSNKLEIKRREEELVLKNIEMERVQNEMKNKLQQNKYLFYFTSALTLSLLATSLFLIVTNRQKKLLRRQKEEVASINEELNQLIGQKETLIKEVNHRVKNNLGILTGLMYMKEKQLKDTTAVKTLRDMQSRIQTISLIHETLYQREDVGHIDFQKYLERLSAQLAELYPSEKRIRTTINCAGFNPELTLAMPLSMMLNELFTNSIKYAFANVDTPEIVITYHPEDRVLEYHDNGPGYEFKTSEYSLGQKLLHILATQIGGVIESINDGPFQKIRIMLKEN